MWLLKLGETWIHWKENTKPFCQDTGWVITNDKEDELNRQKRRSKRIVSINSNVKKAEKELLEVLDKRVAAGECWKHIYLKKSEIIVNDFLRNMFDIEKYARTVCDETNKENKKDENEKAAMILVIDHYNGNDFGILIYKPLWVKKTSKRLYNEDLYSLLWIILKGTMQLLEFCWSNLTLGVFDHVQVKCLDLLTKNFTWKEKHFAICTVFAVSSKTIAAVAVVQRVTLLIQNHFVELIFITKISSQVWHCWKKKTGKVQTHGDVKEHEFFFDKRLVHHCNKTFTQVFVNWKEHPPDTRLHLHELNEVLEGKDNFFTSFGDVHEKPTPKGSIHQPEYMEVGVSELILSIWMQVCYFVNWVFFCLLVVQLSNLSSLRTRMFQRGKNCYRNFSYLSGLVRLGSIAIVIFGLIRFELVLNKQYICRLVGQSEKGINQSNNISC